VLLPSQDYQVFLHNIISHFIGGVIAGIVCGSVVAGGVAIGSVVYALKGIKLPQYIYSD